MDYFERIAGEWCEHAAVLAAWVMTPLATKSEMLTPHEHLAFAVASNQYCSCESQKARCSASRDSPGASKICAACDDSWR
jgi:hypothetical protein